MVKAYISIGSNLTPISNVRASISALGKVFGTLEVSPVYQSAALGFEGADFLNLVVALETDKSADEVISVLLDIETQLGRDRSGPKFSDRTMDLDLLIYGNEAIFNDNTEIPRPEIEEYAHVLVPLVDLAAEQKHPLSGRTYLEMLTDMQSRDPAQVFALRIMELSL